MAPEPTGRAVGIDMTPAMIERARRNAAQPVRGQVLTNVEFHLATIDRLPLSDARRAGANYFLRKPDDLDSIPETVARLLARKKGKES